MTVYFVMLYHPSEKIRAVPLVDENENIVWFKTEKEALEVARNTGLGEAYGYEVFGL